MQDLVKEQLVNKKVKPAQQSNSVLTPNYMLNCIIRLQAVIEMITNKAAQVLEFISSQQSQTKTVVYQNRLALDYLLAKEGVFVERLLYQIVENK